MQVNALYELHKPAFDIEGMYWYYGAGGHVGFYSSDYDPPYADNDYDIDQPVLGIDGIVGLEYRIKEIPFTVGVDVKPFVEFTEPDFYFWDAAFSFRLTF